MSKSGTVDEFAAFLTIKPGKADELAKAAREYVDSPARSGADPEAFRLVVGTGIHDIRLTIFDNGTRLLFATSFDVDWEPYVYDSLRAMQGVAPWGHFLQYTEEAPEGVEIPGAVTDQQAMEFLNTHRVEAAAYGNTMRDVTLQDMIKGRRLEAVFQEVLDNPEAAEALMHPALKPLLDLASE